MQESKPPSKKTITVLKWCYKALRSVLFSAIIVVAGLFTILYCALAIPQVQNLIKEKAESELSAFLGNPVVIDRLTIHPLNELIIKDASFLDGEGDTCVSIESLGAGINLFRLILGGKIEITYVELIDFNIKIKQKEPDAPLNIDYIIKAFQPRDKNKPPTAFDLKIQNVVIRGGNIFFDREWQPVGPSNKLDFNHLAIENFCGDITFPHLSNDDSEVKIRRISFTEKSGLIVNKLAGDVLIYPRDVHISDFVLRLPESELKLQDFILPLAALKKHNINALTFNIIESKITPSNLACFYPPLSDLDVTLPVKGKIVTDFNKLTVDGLRIGPSDGIDIKISADVSNFSDMRNISINVDNLNIDFNPALFNITTLITSFKNDAFIANLVNRLGSTHLNLQGGYNPREALPLSLNTEIQSTVGEIVFSSRMDISENIIKGEMDIDVERLSLAEVFPSIPLKEIRGGRIKADGVFHTKDLFSSQGNVEIQVVDISILDKVFSNIKGTLSQKGKDSHANLSIDDDNLKGSATAKVVYDGPLSQWDIRADVNKFDTYSSFLTKTGESTYELKGDLEAHAIGNSIDCLDGRLEIKDFSVIKNGEKRIDISSLTFDVESENKMCRSIVLSSEMVDVNVTGEFVPSRIPEMFKKAVGELAPSLYNPMLSTKSTECGNGDFTISLKNVASVIKFFDLSIFPLTDVLIKGSFNSDSNHFELATTIPYLQQGDNKLISDTYIDISVSGKSKTGFLSLGSLYPTKKGLLKIDMDVSAKDQNFNINCAFNKDRNVSFFGDIAILLRLDRNPVDGKLNISAEWKPSSLYLNGAEWKVGDAEISYDGKLLRIRDFSIRHADQFLSINGFSNSSDEGEIKLLLADIDLDYIFDTLNINHVAFGGIATGSITARNIFSKNPHIATDRLLIKNFAYNGALLGEGDISAYFNLPEKKIGIGADITEGERLVAKAEGGIWLGKDSLSFAFDADKINVGFMQPFMSAFSSDLKGRASGKALLYGKFSDIDMTGTIEAHDISLLIDYINTVYRGNATVFMTPGKIEIPQFEITDKNNNTATVTGELRHRYFHEPVFNFRIYDMKDLLVYDTNSKINPFWYGTLHATGSGEIEGKPGLVRIIADAATAPNSEFTFVLSDQQEAVKSNFLTFSDKRKEEREKLEEKKDSVPAFLQKFRKTLTKTDDKGSIIEMDLRVDVTDAVKFNLVMDPIAGDKIVAYGSGAMTLTYSSLNNDLRLYGKYTLDRGLYNFSLQDIILKEFIIKPGSSIAFTGDPYSGILDLTAAYRVNTSLTELDQSFANDRDLNRTSVPVEALLKVHGSLTSPDIDFDIDLPTVTEETSRKVRSIISTDDMMSRQVLYLVALNKFYPPEYMSTESSGGEWASIASSTLSSQIQNVIGQITDKFSFAPSIRSDKGDFSDIEVDLALSSSLLNNRLLINGNVGYRDPSHSSTTFVGDFDLEYLLNPKGTWRVKAYNHFNDQNYYLKSALTTQGLGIVWRKDFGIPSTRPAASKNEEEEEEEVATEWNNQ